MPTAGGPRRVHCLPLLSVRIQPPDGTHTSCVWSADDCGPFGSALTPQQNEAVCLAGGGPSPYGGSRVTARFSGWGRAEVGRVTKDEARCTT